MLQDAHRKIAAALDLLFALAKKPLGALEVFIMMYSGHASFQAKINLIIVVFNLAQTKS